MEEALPPKKKVYKSTPYERGRDREYRVKAKYEELGYHVTRSASSKGEFDLIAVRPQQLLETIGAEQIPLKGHIALIQCKMGATEEREHKKLEKSGIKPKWEGIYRVTVELE